MFDLQFGTLQIWRINSILWSVWLLHKYVLTINFYLETQFGKNKTCLQNLIETSASSSKVFLYFGSHLSINWLSSFIQLWYAVKLFSAPRIVANVIYLWYAWYICFPLRWGEIYLSNLQNQFDNSVSRVIVYERCDYLLFLHMLFIYLGSTQRC